MRYRSWFWVSLLLIIGGFFHPKSIVHAVADQQNGTATLQIINQSTHTVCYVYVSASTESTWGSDRLGEDVLEPEGSVDVSLTAGTYDVQLTDCDGNLLFSQHKLAIVDEYVLTLTDQTVELAQCEAYNQTGMRLYRDRDYQAAHSAWQAALTCFQSAGDRVGEGTMLNNIGGVYYTQGRYDKALENYQQALTIAQEMDDRSGEGSRLNNIAEVYRAQGHNREALALFQQALTIAQEVGDRASEGNTLHNMGLTHYYQGRYREALQSYEQALSIRQEVGNRAEEAITLVGIGLVYHSQGYYDKALKTYRQALAMQQAVGDRTQEGATLHNIAGVYHLQGRYAEALETFGQALSIRREVGDRIGEGQTLLNIGAVYDYQGRYGNALDSYQQALAIQQAVGDRTGEGTTLNNIGLVYDHQDRYNEALGYYQAALTIRQAIGDRIGESATLHNMAAVYESQGHYDEALTTLQQALTIAQAVGDRAGEGATLNGIGRLYEVQGRYAEALVSYEQALTLAQAVGDRTNEGAVFHNIGLIYQNQEHYADALTSYGQALAIRQAIGDRIGEGETLSNIALLHFSAGNYAEALHVFQEAADTLESVRAVAGSETGRSAFISQYRGIYDGMVAAALLLDRPDDAFQAAERGRARAFLDSLATGAVQLGDADSAGLLEAERIAYAARLAAQDALAKAHGFNPRDPALISQREIALQATQQAHADAIAAISRRSEELAALVPGRSTVLELTEVQALLDDDTTLLAYWMLGDTETLAFVITAESFNLLELPEATPDALFGALEGLYGWANPEQPHPRPLRQLYNWLVAPIADYLKTTHIAIVPHQRLHYVPFAGLTDGATYFGEQFTLSVLPSASTLPFLANKARDARTAAYVDVLVFGNPATDLPSLAYATSEAQAIGAFFNTAIYTATAATEAQLWNRIEKIGVLHLAAHGEYNEANALDSAIYLAPSQLPTSTHPLPQTDLSPIVDTTRDGRLATREIFALPLQGADLVTLSACETSVGELSLGDEVVGLTRAFFFAGTPTVLSSLWQVDDAATEALMVAFYHYWKGKGMSKAAALQSAQAHIRANPRWASPFYWAGFVLNGHPGEAATK